ncbi:putative WD repeat-containing protein [Colletotrichum chlorophyti]|uniref:Putative WD repeat-containing protein n=1 Tax=Colletotrichum chlorophyti TaxID=708187 RepID=A0A1Q8RQ13_9PEZI|nr:putative WD repeat-containing protein [Colletotrichum chlorophyti]
MEGAYVDNLRLECQRLHSTIISTGELLRQLVAAHAECQDRLSPLQEELFRVPTVVDTLFEEARNCESERQLFLEVQQVPQVCNKNVNDISEVLSEALQAVPGSEVQNAAVDRAAALALVLETSRRTLGLANEAFKLAKRSRWAAQAGESPPYTNDWMLEEISFIRRSLNEQSSSQQASAVQDDVRHGAHASQSSKRLGFLDFLTTFIGEHSGTTVPASDMAGLAISARNAPRAQLPAPNAEAERFAAVPDLLPPVPSSVTVRHVGKVVMNLEKEPVEIKFTSAANPTSFAVTNFYKDIGLFDASTGQRKRTIKAKGVHMVFSPAQEVVAVLTEHIPEEALRSPRPIPTTHDMVHFEKPALYVVDFSNPSGPDPLRFMLQWHGIRPFSFSPDGQLLAIKGVRNRVEIINSARGSGYGVVRNHSDEVTHAEFTPDGDKLVTMSRDGTLRVTHVKSLRSIAKLEVDNWRNPLQLAVSPIGVIASIWGRTVTIWDYDTGELNSYDLDTARGSEGFPLAISPDLRWLACRSDDGADVADLATGKVIYSARLESGFATSAAFSANGQYLVVGRCTNGHHGRTDSGILNVWEIQT